MLAGCNLDIDRPDLGLDIPSFYRAAGRHVSDTPRPALDWWRGFHSKELTDLIEEAQTSNFDVAAAVARILQADAQSKIAGSALVPTVSLTGNATKSRTSQAGLPAGGSAERESYQFALNASYELDFWGKNRAISRAAEENAIAARFNRDVVNLSTIVSVATAYFQVLASQERIRYAREDTAAATRVLNLIQQRFDAGTASALDVAQQESVVGTLRAAIPPLDQTLRQNMVTLAVLIGQPPANVKIKGGSLYGLTIPRVAPGLPTELMFQRPDIRAAEASLTSADDSLEAARAAFFPSFSLTGVGGTQSPILQLLFTPQSAFYNIAANLTQPILDGGALRGAFQNARGRQLELLNDYRQAIVAAFGDVEIALIAIKDSADRERLQQQVVDSSRRAFDISEQRLHEGTVDLVTVLQTQQTLFQAQDNLIIARLARLQAVLTLFQALGGSWLPPPPLPPVRPGIAARAQAN